MNNSEFKSWWDKLDPITQDVIIIELELTPAEKSSRNIWKNPYENFECIRGKKFVSTDYAAPTEETIKLVRKFDCYGTNLHNLPELSKYITLEEIFFGGTHIRNISELKNQPAIQKMCLYNAPVEDFAALKYLRDLKRICISNTAVSDLSPLTDLNNIEVVVFYNTAISSLLPIMNKKYLKRIRCHNTRISADEINQFKFLHPTCEVLIDENEFDENYDDFTK